MIFPKDEGAGDWKSGEKFEMGRAPFLEKLFLIFLGKKTPKTPAFPSCGGVSPSPHDLDCVEHFGKGILAFMQQEKPL